MFQVLSFRSFVAKDFKGAIDYIGQAQELWHSLAERGMEAAALERMSMYYGRLGKTQEALESLNGALPILRALGDPWGLSMALNDRGDTYELLGEFQEALNDKEQALSIFRSGKWRMDYELGVLADLGHIREEIGDPQKALNYYDQAIELAQSHGDRGLEGRMYSVAAGAYARAGEKDKALDYYNKSLVLAEGNRGDEAWLQLDLGTFYVGQKDYVKALGYFAQILPYFHAEHRSAFERATLYWMGIAYRKQGNRQQALGALNEALSIEKFPNPLRREILREIGSVYLDAGDGPKALEYYEKSLTESRSAKDLQGEAVALCGVARAERAIQQMAEARRDIEEGLEILESIRARIAGAESRSSYSLVAQENYQFYIDLLMQMDDEHPQQGFAAAALQTSERSRVRSLLDLLVEAHADIHQGADPKLLERERVWQQRLRARSEYQVQMLIRPHTPEQVEDVAKELQTLTVEYEEIEAQIRARSPRYAALTQPAPLDLKQIQEQVLDSDTLLLEYALGENRSYLWAVTASGLSSFTLPKRDEIERAARRVYELLTVRNTHPGGQRKAEADVQIARARAEYPAAAARLSEMILGPVATLLNHRRLLIVSDGALQYLPFAVLPLPKEERTIGEPGQPLMVRSEIVIVPSVTMLAALRRDMAGREPAPKAVAVLADPVFDDQDPRVLKRRRLSGAPHTSGVALKRALPMGLERSWAEVGSAEHGWQIPRLPFSRREADSIIQRSTAG